MPQKFLKFLAYSLSLTVLGLSVTQAKLVFTNEDPDWQPGASSAFILDVVDEFDQVDLRFGDALDARIGYDKIDDLIQINRDLDLEDNEFKNFRIENLTTAEEPICDPTFRGKLYFNLDQSRLLICNGIAWVFGDGTLLDEDDFASSSNTLGATQQSIGVYVDNFLARSLDGFIDGKYVLQKSGSLVDFIRIEEESPGGNDLFAASPEAIDNLGYSEKTFSSVSLVWSEPLNTGSPITDYIVQFREAGDTVFTTFADGTSTDTNAVITGLSPATVYEFQVTASNGNLGDPSNLLTVKTFVNDAFFDGSIQVMNVGAATDSVVTAFEDNTVVTLNGTTLTTLTTRGDTFQFTSAAFDILGADKPIFVAGEESADNVVWSLPSWAGEDFAFNSIRNNPQTVRVYAFEDATVEVFQDGTSVATPVSLLEGEDATFVFSVFGSFQVESTGLIMAYHYSSAYVDAKPLLPASRDIIGIPSSSMRLTTTVDGTGYTATHSNSAVALNSLNIIDSIAINPQGASSLYASESLRIQADQPVTGAAYADSNGSAAAPFLPTSFMRTRYAINVNSDYVAFASLEAGTVDLLDSTDAVIATLSLARTGVSSSAPYKAYYDEGDFGGKIPAGTRMVSTVPMAAWYQPGTSVGAGNDDETILFGFD